VSQVVKAKVGQADLSPDLAPLGVPDRAAQPTALLAGEHQGIGLGSDEALEVAGDDR